MTCSCHNQRLRLGRCPVTGHRQPVLGIRPARTRTRIAIACGLLAAAMAAAELAARQAART